MKWIIASLIVYVFFYFIIRASVPTTPFSHSPAPTPGMRTPSYSSRTKARNSFLGLSSGNHVSLQAGTTASSMATSPRYPRSRLSSESSSISHEPLPRNIIINKDPFPVHLHNRLEGNCYESFYITEWKIPVTIQQSMLHFSLYIFAYNIQLLKKKQMSKFERGTGSPNFKALQSLNMDRNLASLKGERICLKEVERTINMSYLPSQGFNSLITLLILVLQNILNAESNLNVTNFQSILSG